MVVRSFFWFPSVVAGGIPPGYGDIIDEMRRIDNWKRSICTNFPLCGARTEEEKIRSVFIGTGAGTRRKKLKHRIWWRKEDVHTRCAKLGGRCGKAGFQRRDGLITTSFSKKLGKFRRRDQPGGPGHRRGSGFGPVQARAAVGDRDLQDLGNFPIGTAPLVKEEKNVPLLGGEPGWEDLGEGKGRIRRRGKAFGQSEDIVRLVPYGVTDDMGEG